MKNVLFPKVITIFKLIYLFWFKMEQTLPRFGVSRFTSAFASACFLSPFPGSCATWLRRSLNSKTLSTAHNGKAIRGRPGRPRNLQIRNVEVTRWPKKSIKTANSSQQWIQEERQKQHSNHHGGLYMIKQFKLVINAQESKTFLK